MKMQHTVNSFVLNPTADSPLHSPLMTASTIRKSGSSTIQTAASASSILYLLRGKQEASLRLLPTPISVKPSKVLHLGSPESSKRNKCSSPSRPGTSTLCDAKTSFGVDIIKSFSSYTLSAYRGIFTAI